MTRRPATKTQAAISYTSHITDWEQSDGTVTALCGYSFRPVPESEAVKITESEWVSCPLCEAADIIDDLAFHWEQGSLI